MIELPFVDRLQAGRLVVPEPFDAVGRWYQDFHEVSDAEVRNLLASRWAAHSMARISG